MGMANAFLERAQRPSTPRTKTWPATRSMDLR